MLPRRSTWSGIVLSSAVIAAGSFLWPTGVQAQEAAPAAVEAAPAASTGNKEFTKLADDFLHYSIVGNDQLAKDNGQALLNAFPDGKSDPKAFLAAFEAAANERDVRGILLRNQRQDSLKDVSAKLLDKLEEGHRAVARDPERIRTEIERLDDNQRAYANAKERLTAAGPYAVPYYIQYLQNEKKKELHPYILRVMVEIGRPLLAPLIEQLATPDVNEKITLIDTIGQIGYSQAFPYLKAIAADEKANADVKKAAVAAIARIDSRKQLGSVSAADAFYNLAQQLYQKQPSAGPQNTSEATAPIWYYNVGLNNVTSTAVPLTSWFDIQAMRAAETCLKLEPAKSQAISLWLAANLRRELALAGAKDPTRPDNTPDASYYAMAAGPLYINPVLTMALADRDTALALKAVQILEATGGTQGTISAKEGQTPLVKALSYPDRGVRFAAAFALARANPAKEFPGSFRVVPVLAEAISQSGNPSVVLVESNQENRNRIKGLLVAKNFTVYDGPSLSAALDLARHAAAFEMVIVPAGPEANRILEIARSDYRLTAAPVLLTTDKEHLLQVHAEITANGLKGYKELDGAGDDAAIADAVTSVRGEIGQTPIDSATAATYSLTAIKLVGSLAVDHASIYMLTEALPALTDALKDKRPEVVTAAAGVLGQFNHPDAQKALATAALADGTDTTVRAALFNSLAESAKRTGNILDAATIDRLIKIVGTADLDPTVRNAAATALGALNVPSNQACTLILQQAK